jgi:hypothetical protein
MIRAGSIIENLLEKLAGGAPAHRPLYSAAPTARANIFSAFPDGDRLRRRGTRQLGRVSFHASRSANRFEALEPVRQGVHRCFGTIASGVARGLKLRHDHGSNYTSGDFQDEIECLGIEASPSFVREPEGNGVAERFASDGIALARPDYFCRRADVICCMYNLRDLPVLLVQQDQQSQQSSRGNRQPSCEQRM